MTMELDGHVANWPGEATFGHRLWAPQPDGTGVTAVLDAIDVLRPVWEPLCAEAVVGPREPVDPEPADLERGHAERAYAFVSRTELPPDVVVDSFWKHSLRTSAPSLSRPVLREWLAATVATAERTCGGPVELTQLRFAASRTRVGAGDWQGDRDGVVLRAGAGPLRAPLERDHEGTWISGPREPAFDQPPLELRFDQWWDGLNLHAVVHYSFWLGAQEPSAVRLREAFARLTDLGWESF